MAPQFQVQLKIRKPLAEVFDAVVRPSQLSQYFVASASGPLVKGTTVAWTFPEFPGSHDVVIHDVVPNERIEIEWAGGEGYTTRAILRFVRIDASATMVQISESGWPDDDAGRALSYGNCEGWMHMMCCMKAYLEFGVHLREGGAL